MVKRCSRHHNRDHCKKLWLALVLLALLAMHTLGAVHAVLHAGHGHKALGHNALVHDTLGHDALGHDEGIACLGFDALSTAVGPLLVLPLGVWVCLYAKAAVWVWHDHALAFLFLHPPAARAPPWF